MPRKKRTVTIIKKNNENYNSRELSNSFKKLCVPEREREKCLYNLNELTLKEWHYIIPC